ncbi:MAG: mechanosensitive ion channel [Pseudomonadota bacterium]
MDISGLLDSLLNTLGEHLPKIAGALIILVIGWIVALVVRAIVRKALSFLKLNQRASSDSSLDLEGGIASGAFWVVLMIAFIAVFDTLNLQLVSQPLNTLVTQVFDYIPQIVGGAVLALVAWLLATAVRMLSAKALAATTLDEKLSVEAGVKPMSDNIGNVLFWFIILIFLPAILGAFQLHGLLDPVQNMVNKILNMLPNIFAAAVIGVVGWFVARILRDLVSNLLSAVGADKLGEKAGLQGTVSISRLVGTIIFVFVFVPALIASLNALEIESISRPATDMLTLMIGSIPDIFGAAIILVITYFVAQLISDLVSSLLMGIGFDSLPAKLGINIPSENSPTPSQMVGKVVVFFAMLFATVEAANRLGFEQVRDIVSVFIQFGGQILLGGTILAVGFWLANLAYSSISKVGSAGAANIARMAIMMLVAGMGLRAMGIADDIVNLAFGLTLGAVAVAIALSFGLGGREAAGKQMDHWLSKMRNQ